MDRNSEIDASNRPKYVCLRDEFLAAIQTGLWKSGERLPAEAAFADLIPVGLGTIQRALRMLACDGVVVRRHRDGTFVAGVEATADEIIDSRFLADDSGNIVPVFTKVRAIGRCVEGGPWTSFLGPETRFVRIERLVRVNLEFQAFSEIYPAETRFGAFLHMSAQSHDGAALAHMLGERFNAPVLRTVRYFRVETVPEAICHAIGVPVDTIGMQWQILAHGYRETPISCQRVHVPPNPRRLEVRESLR